MGVPNCTTQNGHVAACFGTCVHYCSGVSASQPALAYMVVEGTCGCMCLQGHMVLQAMEGQPLPKLVEGETLPLAEIELHQVSQFSATVLHSRHAVCA